MKKNYRIALINFTLLGEILAVKEKISVVGGGSWGTSVANLIAKNGFDVSLWCFEDSVVQDIVKYRINKRYLPGIELDKKIALAKWFDYKIVSTRKVNLSKDWEAIMKHYPLLSLIERWRMRNGNEAIQEYINAIDLLK